MAINPLSQSIGKLLVEEPVTNRSNTGSSDPGFSNILSEAFETAEETDNADKISALELLTGQTDDMSGLLLDASKAELSFQLALQIKNKVVEAYNELMRTQV